MMETKPECLANILISLKLFNQLNDSQFALQFQTSNVVVDT